VLPDARVGSTAGKSGSMRTVPVNQSDGPALGVWVPARLISIEGDWLYGREESAVKADPRKDHKCGGSGIFLKKAADKAHGVASSTPRRTRLRPTGPRHRFNFNNRSPAACNVSGRFAKFSRI
jgi:hypothetical protein